MVFFLKMFLIFLNAQFIHKFLKPRTDSHNFASIDTSTSTLRGLNNNLHEIQIIPYK